MLIFLFGLENWLLSLKETCSTRHKQVLWEFIENEGAQIMLNKTKLALGIPFPQTRHNKQSWSIYSQVLKSAYLNPMQTNWRYFSLIRYLLESVLMRKPKLQKLSGQKNIQFNLISKHIQVVTNKRQGRLTITKKLGSCTATTTF